MPTYDAEKCKLLIQRKFDFLLNAMERAAAEENPAHHDYRGKCAAVHEHVAELKDQLFAATQEIERLTRENEMLRKLVDDFDSAARYTLGTLPSPGCRGAVETTNADWVAVHKGRATSAHRQLQRAVDAIRRAAGVEGKGE